MKTKYDARHQLKQLGWTDQELDAIGLTPHDEGAMTIPEHPWATERFQLIEVIEEGSVKTFRYKDLEELPKNSNFRQSIKRLFGFTE